MLSIASRLAQLTHAANSVIVEIMIYYIVDLFYFRIGAMLTDGHFAHVGQTTFFCLRTFFQAVLRVFRSDFDNAVEAADKALGFTNTRLATNGFTQ